MEIKIVETMDENLLARLNHDVQEIHNIIEPDIFKPFSADNMAMLFKSLLGTEDINAYVAEVDSVPAGYMILSHKHFEENFFKFAHSVLYIDQICVEADYKGMGIGKALVDFAKAYAKHHQIHRIEMNYWTKNKNSGEFFRSQGFANFNERLFIKVD